MIRNGVSRWCPLTSKKELVDWASKYFEKPKVLYRHLNKRQLYAMFYKEHHNERN